MSDELLSLPLPSEEARNRLQAMGASVMFEKVLTSSDTSGSGRIVIPKVSSMTDNRGTAQSIRNQFVSLLCRLKYRAVAQFTFS